MICYIKINLLKYWLQLKAIFCAYNKSVGIRKFMELLKLVSNFLYAKMSVRKYSFRFLGVVHKLCLVKIGLFGPWHGFSLVQKHSIKSRLFHAYLDLLEYDVISKWPLIRLIFMSI